MNAKPARPWSARVARRPFLKKKKTGGIMHDCHEPSNRPRRTFISGKPERSEQTLYSEESLAVWVSAHVCVSAPFDHLCAAQQAQPHCRCLSICISVIPRSRGPRYRHLSDWSWSGGAPSRIHLNHPASSLTVS